MTTKLKEKLITLSRKEKELNIFLGTYLVILLILFILSRYIEAVKPIYSVLALIGVYPILLIYTAISALNNYDAETIRNNKLIYLILSDCNTAGRYVLWFIIFPVLWMVTSFVKLNFISGVIITVVSVAGTIKLENIISNYCKKKLSKK